jgi:phosphatidylglycerol:prolipoprotein diacylglycerol transferase
MLPVLFRLGPLTIRTYGVAVALAFLFGILLVRRGAKQRGINPDSAYDIVLAAMLGGIIGARIVYVMKNWSEFAQNPLEIFATWQGGLVFYGGLIGGTLAVLLAIVRIRRLPMGKVADIVAPALALGSAIGRLGCFCNGCCYGKQTGVPWAITFTDSASAASPLGTPLHPTQLYEFSYNILILAVLLWAEKRFKSDGLLFWLFITLYGLFRFIVEFFRTNPVAFAGMSASQIFSALMFVVGISVIVFRYSGRKQMVVERADS